MNDDLISRSELKKAIDTIKQIGYDTENKPLFDYVELPDLIKVIDNAPTVEPDMDFAKECYANGYEDGKNERPQGDLISRSELKKCAIPCEIHNGALTDLCVPLYQVDNAPTVEYTFEEAFQKTVCENRLYCPARPQGEWKINLTTGDIFCSCCKEVRRDTRIKHINFCNSCGADMRGDKNGKS